MAKSSKPRKTTSSTQKTGQPASTVTPIGPAGSLREKQNRDATPSERIHDLKNQDQRNQADVIIEEEIRIRAYELFEQRGRQEGFHDEDWSRAEAEILAKYRRDKSA